MIFVRLWLKFAPKLMAYHPNSKLYQYYKVLETLQKEHKYLIDATINHSITKTVETSNEKMVERFVKPM